MVLLFYVSLLLFFVLQFFVFCVCYSYELFVAPSLFLWSFARVRYQVCHVFWVLRTQSLLLITLHFYTLSVASVRHLVFRAACVVEYLHVYATHSVAVFAARPP